ncbi:hypothetical protein KR093_004804, partial [Drosophila rubida]
DDGLLKYKPGNFYEYAFESILTVGLSSGLISEADDTSLKVIGSAKVFANGNCDYTLQVGPVKVINTKQSLEKKLVANIQKPVHFSWASGQLQPEICIDASDTEYSLNIKRAIISLLQAGNNAESISEVDVFGQCPTYTSSSKPANGGETITKVRDLNQCAFREQINSGILSGVVNAQAGIKSSSLLQADYSKELTLQQGIIEHVQLIENYKFTGNPRGNLDVSAKVVSNLKLKNGAAGTPGATPTPTTRQRSGSIIFQKYGTYAAKNIAALKVALSDLIDSTNDYVKKDTAIKFIELIRLLRNSDTDTILDLSAVPYPNKALARKAYLDALFRTNTAESARAILKQLNKFNENEKLLAILSLNLVESVDKETLNQAALQLLPNAPKELYLVIGNLISKLCSKTNCETSEIEGVSKKFFDGLKHCKASTKKDEERIIHVLKGIGNSHILVNNLVPALTECVSPGRSNRIRVAALQAFSTSKCNDALNSKALELLKNANEDSELRIEAYVTVTNCPTAELANQISELVNSEKVYQVGSFISSSLKTIRDSTDVSREQQRYHLGNIRVTKQFPQDYRRYSFNHGYSHRLDALGASANTDYKLIYSQHGFLPRSARFNVSAEVFGTSFNVIEGNLRQENLENLLEYYVGPKGLLNKDFDEIVKLIEAGNAQAAGGAAGRSKRSIADDVSKISKKYKTYGSKNVQDLSLDLSFKLFGSELAFLSLGDNIPSTLDDIIKYFSDAFDKVKKELSSFEKQFTSHHLFLDAELSYPTGLGVPIEFGAQGFAANKIDFAINVDVNDILEQNWQRSKYRFKLVPSIDVNVNVQLGFNTQVLSTGLRVTSTAHSATGSDVTVSLINNGEGFNVNVDLPREKLELIDVQANAEFFVAENDKQLKSVPLKTSSKKPKTTSINNEFCFSQLEIVGFNICIASSSSLKDFNAESGKNLGLDDFQLSMPFMLKVYSKSERKFNLKGTKSTLPTGSHQWKLEYSTPGSKVPHDTSVAFELGTKPKTYGRLALDNPQYHLGVEAGITNDNKELVLYGQYEQDKDVKKSKIGFSKHGDEYKPLIEIHDKNGIINNINGYRADGKITVQKSGDKQTRYNFQNFQLLSPSNERIVINGWTDVAPNTLNTELRIAPGQESYLVKSNFKFDKSQYEAALFVSNERTANNVYGSSVHVIIGNNAYNLKLIGQAFTWTVKSTSAFKFVKSDSSNTLSSSQFSSDLQIDHQNKPYGSVKVDTNFDVNKLEISAAAMRDQSHVASLNVKYQSNQRSVRDFELLGTAKINKHSVDVVFKCDANGNLLIVDNSIKTSWGTSITVKGELGQRYTAQDVHIDLQGSAQFRTKEKALQWLLKVLGTPEKTNSEFRVSRDNAELIKLTTETQHPLDKVSAAKFNLVLKNQLNAKCDFKIAKNGKGELTAIIETQKVEPKHKIEIDSKFQIQAPKYDIDTSITIDGDKKLHFKTENNVDKLKFSTKNLLESDNKKMSIEVNGALKGDWRSNGDIQGAFTLVAPDGHVFDGSLNRHITTNPKTHITQGTATIQLNEQQPGNGEKRSISLKSTLDTLNIKTKELSLNSQIVLNAFNGRKAELNSHIKQSIKGKSNSKSLEIDLSIQGNLVEDQLPVELSFVVDEYSAQYGIGRIHFKLGDRISANLNGNIQIKLPGDGVPTTYELQANLQAPQAKFRSFELNSHGKLLRAVEGGNGANNLEFQLNTKTGDGHFTRVNTNWKGSVHQGSYTFEAQNNYLSAPLKFDGSYQYEEKRDSESSCKLKNIFNAQYGDKYLKHQIDVNVAPKLKTTAVQWQLDTSHESIKNLELNIQSFKVDEDTYVMRLDVKEATKKYELESKWFGAPHKKGLELHINFSEAQPIVIVTTIEILGDRKSKLKIDIQHLADLDFKINLETSYSSIDDFYILGDWNSKKLQLDNYELDIKAQNKSIKAIVKNARSVLISGTATYNLKKDQNKAIIEGQGQFQKQGKTVSSNFKLTRQDFALSTEQEVGASYSLNGNVGPTNMVATLKFTNKEFNLKISTCEEKRQCMNIQAQSTLIVDEKQLDTSEHGILVLMDLREIGYPYELELKSKNKRQGFKHQYSLDGHISGHNLKYQLNVNFLPTDSTIRLTLPKRQILFESLHKSPTDGKIFGHYEQSAAFYIDKLQRPNDVARLSAVLDISGVDQISLNSRLLLKMEHPTIRPLTISGTVDADRAKRYVNSEFIFDLFKSTEQKIIASSQIRKAQAQQNSIGSFDITSNQKLYSSGLKFQYEINIHTALNVDAKEFTASTELKSNNLNLGANVLVNKDHLDLTVNALDNQIIAVKADLDWKKYSAKINSKVQALAGQKPIEIFTELQPNWGKISLDRQNLINANAEIKLGKEFKFAVNTDSGKSVANGRVALDAANFLQADYKINEDDFKTFVNTLETELKKNTAEITDKLKKQIDKASGDFDEKLKIAKESKPDFDKLWNSYEKQIKTIIHELEVDPTLAPIIESTRKLIEKLNILIAEVSKAFVNYYQELCKAVEEVLEKLHELWKNSILKAWEQFVASAAKVLEKLHEELFNVYSKVFKNVVAWLDKYGPLLKNYAKVFYESLKPVSEAVQELIKVIGNGAEDILVELKEYLSKLPTFDAIRNEIVDKVKQFKLIEKLLELMTDIFTQLHILPQTPETDEFLQKLQTYLRAKLKQEPINEDQLLEELSKLFMKSLRSIWLSLESNVPVSGLPVADLETWTAAALPQWLDKMAKLPTILSFRSSVINAILNEKWGNTFNKNIYATWIYSVAFQKFELHGQLVDGQHVFTFDGHSYVYPGNCRYILAQDSVDNNFTVVAQLSSDSKLKGITLIDRDGNFVEVSDTATLKMNGKPVEYPQHIPGIHAWRKFYGLYLHSEYGVTVTCTTDLRVCHVIVNGFYTSKTRGLLGNGNAEPYDDYLLIDGTIASNSATFGNDYSIGKCNPITWKGEQEVHNEICNEIFGIESTLALNYLQLDARPYRKACDYAVQGAAEKDKESVACTFALAYGSALSQLKHLVLLPPRCLKCTGAVGQRELGEEFTIKTPTNKADLVFVVDINVTPKVLSNLVAPAITEIRDALKSRGFTDVQVIVIAFDESKRYPSLLTSDNGKINYKANVANVQVNGPNNFCDNCVEQIITDKRVLDIYKLLERFVKTIVPQSDESAFSLALDYPFRAGAAKSIIGIRSDSLEYNNWWKLVRAHITGSLTKFDGAQLHLIAPIKGLALEGVPAEKLVGKLATLDGKDNKKRSKLQFESDMGIDFVLNNGGWAFTTNNFDKLKTPEQRKVLNHVVSSIADTLFKTETVSDCRCVPLAGLFGQHKCAIKSTNFVPNKKSKGA